MRERHAIQRASSAIAVLMALVAGAAVAQAQEPMRLRLERYADDVAAGGACVRGRLVLVRSFDQDGVWVADSLEVAAKGVAMLPAGHYDGVARGRELDEWRIEIPAAGAVLKAQPESGSEVSPAVLLGRQARPPEAGSCAPQLDRLTDGAAIVRRLRRIYGSPENERPVELGVEK